MIEYAGSDQQFPTLSDTDLEPGAFTDALAASIGLPVHDLVQLLEEGRIEKRVELLETKMMQMLVKGGPSIISFSNTWDFPNLNMN